MAASEGHRRSARSGEIPGHACDYRDGPLHGRRRHLGGVLIINQSEQRVRRPRIETIGGARPTPRVGEQVYIVNEDGEEIGWSPEQVLDPGKSIRVPYQPLNADGQPLNIPAAFMADTLDKYVPRVEDVTISFYMFDVRWWRVGNRDSVRVEPASAD